MPARHTESSRFPAFLSCHACWGRLSAVLESSTILYIAPPLCSFKQTHWFTKLDCSGMVTLVCLGSLSGVTRYLFTSHQEQYHMIALQFSGKHALVCHPTSPHGEISHTRDHCFYSIQHFCPYTVVNILSFWVTYVTTKLDATELGTPGYGGYLLCNKAA